MPPPLCKGTNPLWNNRAVIESHLLHLIVISSSSASCPHHLILIVSSSSHNSPHLIVVPLIISSSYLPHHLLVLILFISSYLPPPPPHLLFVIISSCLHPQRREAGDHRGSGSAPPLRHAALHRDAVVKSHMRVHADRHTCVHAHAQVGCSCQHLKVKKKKKKVVFCTRDAPDVRVRARVFKAAETKRRGAAVSCPRCAHPPPATRGPARPLTSGGGVIGEIPLVASGCR